MKKTSKVEAFLQEVVEVCKKHGMAIGHQDSQGAFVVEAFTQESVEWLLDAVVSKELKGEE